MDQMQGFEVYRTRGSKKFQWRLKAANGEIVATGHRQAFSRRIDCVNSINLVQGTNADTPIKFLASASG